MLNRNGVFRHTRLDRVSRHAQLRPGISLTTMKSFTTYPSARGKHTINPGLLWEYSLENFDWQKNRRIVVERVMAMGRLSDFYAAFDLYGGIRGFKRIVRDEVIDMSPRDLNFACHAFNLDPTETRCYKQEQARQKALFQREDE